MYSSTVPVRPSPQGPLIQLETLSLCAFAFVLPQFEAPKNVLWLVLALLWIINRWRARNFGGPWDAWDTLIAVWIASGYVSALNAGLNSAEWASAADVLRYGSVLWIVRRSGYGDATLRQMAVWLFLGTLAGLLRGYYELNFVPRADLQPRNLGLNSVGHVNHSAIYVAITFGAALAWVLGGWRSDPIRHRIMGLAICATLVLSLFVMASRASVAVSIFVGLTLLAIYALRNGNPLWKILLGAIVFVSAVAITRPEVVEKNSMRLKESNLFAFRDDIWRAGLQAWREYPAFGVGMGNYGKIDYAHLERWSAARGETLDRSRVLPQSHAHSLYINTLVERGAAGLLTVMAVLLAWALSLWRAIPLSTDNPVRWTFWGGSLAAWLVAVLVGLVNTTLHHEHALISVLLLGGWLALSRGQTQNLAARG